MNNGKRLHLDILIDGLTSDHAGKANMALGVEYGVLRAQDNDSSERKNAWWARTGPKTGKGGFDTTGKDFDAGMNIGLAIAKLGYELADVVLWFDGAFQPLPHCLARGYEKRGK